MVSPLKLVWFQVSLAAILKPLRVSSHLWLGLTTADIDAKLNQSWVKADSYVPITTLDAANIDLIDKVSAYKV